MLFENWGGIEQAMRKTIRLPIFLLLLVSLMASGQALAQSASCNPNANMTIIDNPGPFFLDETLRVSANIGARDIGNGNYLDIPAFGFALNCEAGQNFQNCVSAGNTVEFLGNMASSCVDSAGDPVNLLIPQANVIPMQPDSLLPIRTPANTMCNVQFDIAIRDLDEENTNRKINQALGWPVQNKIATCDNGLTANGSATMSYTVHECGIDLEKQVSTDGGTTWHNADSSDAAPQLLLGGTAQYRLVVKNTGSIAFNAPISVVDAALGIDTTIPALAAGGTTTVTSSQIPALLASGQCQVVGSVQNQSSVEGSCRGGNDPVSATAGDSAWIECVGAPGVSIEKSTNGQDADTPTGPQIAVGGAVTWSYLVANTGTLPLTNVAVTDSDIGAITCPGNTLAVGANMTCTANGTAVAGQYSNTGTVTADSTGGSVNDSDLSHYFGSAPSIDIDKTASPNTYTSDGESITYTFVVTNNGNVTLTNVTVTDPLPGLGAITCNWAGSTDGSTPAGTLSAAESVTCTAPYTTTQDDVNAGQVDNTATATGTPPVGTNVQDTDDATITSSAQPSILVLKEISIDDGQTWLDANDVGTAAVAVFPSGALYRITVENDGSVALKNVEVDDTELGIANHVIGNLAVGQIVVLTSGELGQLDVAEVCDGRGTFTNTAQASGESQADDTPVNDSDAAVLQCIGEASIDIVKEISVDGGNTWFDGETPPQEPPSDAWYRITLTNDGTAPLEDIVLQDGDLPVPLLVEDFSAFEPLAPGDFIVLTSGELDELFVDDRCTGAGSVDNMSEVNAVSVDDPNDTVSDSDSATLICVGAPMIEVVKEISLDNSSWVDANTVGEALVTQAPDDVYYRITIRNVGTVAVENIVLNDGTLGITDYAVGTIAAGNEVVLTNGTLPALFYADRCTNAGNFGNTATAQGQSVDTGTTSSDSDQAWLVCTGTPMIQIVKEISIDGASGPWFDDTSPQVLPPADAWYRLTVSNVGTADLENVVVNDTSLGIVDFPIGDLAIGASVVLGQNEIGALYQQDRCTTSEIVLNTAAASGDSVDFPFGSVNDSDTATLDCQEVFDLCEELGRPNELKITYDADDDTNHDQAQGVTIAPTTVNFPAIVDVLIYNDSGGGGKLLVTYTDVEVGDPMFVPPAQGNKIPPQVGIEIRDTNTGALLQRISFHGSCSEPLNVGDEFGGITVLGGVYYN